MSGLTGLDMIVLLAIFGGAVLGMIRGFVVEAISMIAWVGAIIALKFLHGPVTKMLTSMVGGPSAASVLAFGLLFLIVYAGGKLAAATIGGRVRASGLGPLDRALGFGFGAMKGLIIVTLAYLLFNLGYDLFYGKAAERPLWMRDSRTNTLLNATGRAIVDWVGHQREEGGLVGAVSGDKGNAAEKDENDR